jgi:hypothetical protein
MGCVLQRLVFADSRAVTLVVFGPASPRHRLAAHPCICPSSNDDISTVGCEQGLARADRGPYTLCCGKCAICLCKLLFGWQWRREYRVLDQSGTAFGAAPNFDVLVRYWQNIRFRVSRSVSIGPDRRFLCPRACGHDSLCAVACTRASLDAADACDCDCCPDITNIFISNKLSPNTDTNDCAVTDCCHCVVIWWAL